MMSVSWHLKTRTQKEHTVPCCMRFVSCISVSHPSQQVLGLQVRGARQRAAHGKGGHAAPEPCGCLGTQGLDVVLLGLADCAEGMHAGSGIHLHFLHCPPVLCIQDRTHETFNGWQHKLLAADKEWAWVTAWSFET